VSRNWATRHGGSGTAARIGHLTGARVLVTGRLFTVEGETTAALKIMSTETGRVFWGR